MGVGQGASSVAGRRSSNTMASSGHATTQSPHARQSSARGVRAVLRSCRPALIRPTKPSALNSSAVRVPSSNTEYGHTSTHSSFPSHLARSIRGTQLPGAARHFSPGRPGSVAARRALAESIDPAGRTGSPGAVPFIFARSSRLLHFSLSRGILSRSAAFARRIAA
jgi:hypothetical protein